VTVADESASGTRGARRLLWDCATIGNFIDNDRPPARERLISEVGEELAAILLHQPDEIALARDKTA
jgi:hypothetical protein